MVWFRYIFVNTLHTGDKKDVSDDDNDDRVMMMMMMITTNEFNTSIINQQMHLHIFHIKHFKNT